MIIVYGIHTKVYSQEQFPAMRDPLGGEQGVAMGVTMRYFTCFWIPYWASGKRVRAISVESGQPVPVLLWSEEMKREADKMIAVPRGVWAYRIPTYAVLLALVWLVGWLTLTVSKDTSDRNRQADYTATPAPGDVILAKVITSAYTDTPNESWLAIFRIVRIDGDSLIVRRSPQTVDAMELYRIKDKEKLIRLFDLDIIATTPMEVYNLTKYRQGDQLLRLIEPRMLNRAEASRWDSIVRHSQMIEPLYVKRPKR